MNCIYCKQPLGTGDIGLEHARCREAADKREKTNGGGPAFPTTIDLETCTGMSLRDWFAGMEQLSDYDGEHAVMPVHAAELLTGIAVPNGGWKGDTLDALKFEAAWRAALRYMRADAMLAASERKI